MAFVRSIFHRSLLIVIGLSIWANSVVFAQENNTLEALRSSLQPLIDSSDDSSIFEAAQATADWVESLKQDASQTQLSDLPAEELEWLLRAVTLTDCKAEGGFAVTWTGQIKPSISGEYTFSISPINISSEFRDEIYSQWMTVTVDGNQVINATPEDWVFEGSPINLSSNAPVPLKVTYRYECAGNDYGTGKTPAAFLFWKGPGISKSVVPATALSTSDGTTAGLKAEYKRLNAGGEEVIATAVEPTLERLWLSKRNFICPHPEVQQQLIAELWDRLTDPDLLDDIENANPLQRVFLYNLVDHASYLNCQQRAEFLQLLLTRPDLVEQLTIGGVKKIFDRFRHGAEEPAIQLLGTWMQMHPNAEPKLTADFFGENRGKYRRLTVSLVWQDRSGFDRLLNDYLELPDGSCCLPAAYTLAYGHLVQGEIEEWVELLDAKLDDDTLTGDRRVNWLLARAQAEEIRYGQPARHVISRERLLVGREWLVEAQLVAEGETVSRQISRERVSRLATTGKWESAKQLLSQATADSVGQEELAEWQKEIDAMELAAVQLKKQHENEARQAYFDELRRRKKRATNRGDSFAVERYADLISNENE